MPLLRSYRVTSVAMDTLVSLEVIAAEPEAIVRLAMQRAMDWFAVVERACSRFDPASEVRRLTEHSGQPAPVSPVLFEAVRFAVALARRTRGAFDPTVGQALESLGFDRHYVTGERSSSALAAAGPVSYRDVRLNPRQRTVTLRQPLVLDLGAVVKGLALDLASRELLAFAGSCVDAGGDLVARGQNPDGGRWRIGVQAPRAPEATIGTLEVTDQAVCSSGDYERRTADGQGHHLLDARTGRPATELSGVTVVAPTAMAADALSTAIFVLGRRRGLRLAAQEGVGAVLVTAAGEVHVTPDLLAAGIWTRPEGTDRL